MPVRIEHQMADRARGRFGENLENLRMQRRLAA
jgi:hypothetical protein